MTKPEDLSPISTFFFDDPGPHVVRAGFTQREPGTPRVTPARGQELRALLNTSIAQLGAVSGETRRRPTAPLPPLPPPVAIETLLYRGRTALDRALELREDILEYGGAPSPEEIGELLDLIALASTE